LPSGACFPPALFWLTPLGFSKCLLVIVHNSLLLRCRRRYWQ
jgi:hypothetical protein